eukprot:758946-Hanusia_phi.AAC.1
MIADTQASPPFGIIAAGTDCTLAKFISSTDPLCAARVREEGRRWRGGGWGRDARFREGREQVGLEGQHTGGVKGRSSEDVTSVRWTCCKFNMGTSADTGTSSLPSPPLLSPPSPPSPHFSCLDSACGVGWGIPGHIARDSESLRKTFGVHR